MNIIEMAKQAGFKQHQEQAPGIDGVVGSWAELETFAALVEAQEREACIKVCMESKVQAMDFTGGTYVGGYFANAIKQRGETK